MLSMLNISLSQVTDWLSQHNKQRCFYKKTIIRAERKINKQTISSTEITPMQFTFLLVLIISAQI